ncbi:MAG: selenocysteine lyase/cysteine desulfurase [Halioglobus sp.]|jgi:selenocysteine lyase/cysteine desulfurase
MSALIDQIRDSVIGSKQRIKTPFGDKPLVYADYTASGRSLSFIEDYIRQQVLPFYANTHTETSFTGAQTTVLREEARMQIRSSVNGGEQDKVIFCGSGATAAVNKLIDILNLRLPADLSRRYHLLESIPEAERPVVFVGPYEHHSNELPWRESIAEVVCIPLTRCGRIDIEILAQRLQAFSQRPLLIGSFSAASNVTGIKSDVATVSALLKKHAALVFWDYAAAAPYIAIDMNAETPFDAVFISPHKFIGGPGTPGVLVAKSGIFTNSVPAVVGGGTVSYVTPHDHAYIADHERREEGGTPGIVESIRAGLVFKLQSEVGTAQIERLEASLVQRAIARFRLCDRLKVMGNPDAERVSIVSLRFVHADKDLHYGFVVSLLNDLFGIQVRGGCSCAGPYGHSLLGMDMEYSRAIESEISQGVTVLRPGWVRLNFNYFIGEDEFEYLLRAVELVAEHGWRILPFYSFEECSGTWRFQGQSSELLSSLNNFSFSNLCLQSAPNSLATESLNGKYEEAEQELLLEDRQGLQSTMILGEESERLRWFLLPQEASEQLSRSGEPEQLAM